MLSGSRPSSPLLLLRVKRSRTRLHSPQSQLPPLPLTCSQSYPDVFPGQPALHLPVLLDTVRLSLLVC
ncbi:hypothetical protein MUK42_06027 [Musa troglodytarum]|uniref:Uncharacterized protein n=1 Tax=Musa troglodytarum TaxID=320322 RepID=A0A9E7KMV1_9LILI|nr:hypothetical protein MUK42_06027 [Musa troglodytarum]